MAPSPRPDQHLHLGHLPQLPSQPRSGSSTANTSPIEPPAGSAVRSPFGNPNPLGGVGTPSGNARKGAGSPSHELGGRLYSKRAREIQAQEGLTPSLWGPPASGGSTPLRETIPESPTQDGFPDFMTAEMQQSSARRTRAGTLPSRFSSSAASPGVTSPQSLQSRSSKVTPSTSPFRSPSLLANGARENSMRSGSSTSALLSRLRAGSLPHQRSTGNENPNPFGSSVFSSGWGAGRDRASTLTNMHPAEGLDSPAQTSFSRDGLADTDVRTLDYLGLAETPVQTQATLAQPTLSSLNAPPFRYDLLGLNKNMNRFRSYSVNAKEKYAEDDEDYLADGHYSGQHSGVMTPVDAALAQTQYQIQQHNLAVQAYANQATASRPRARTAGVLDSPGRPSGRSFLPTPTSLNSTITAADLGLTNGLNYATLPDALQAMQLNGLGGRSGLDMADENSQDVPTRALWLGNIPTSTTSTSLEMIFRNFGEIQSARVLVHKNCGFVNFETIESAMKARSILHGKEIFPGSGPVRIGYAKVPSSSATDTPDNTGTKASSSPDPFESSQGETRELSGNDKVDGALTANSMHAQSNAAAALHVPDLPDLRDDILHIVREFGATDREQYQIEENIDAAIGFDNFASEIAPVPEPSHNRVHDAPRLREIRKRIDNNTISALEIEEIAVGMLPEIVELSSDYLGNTVVQKLFEYCSEDIKHQMLAQIDPHLAEIGVHKNGTWACQKIIDVSKVPSQMGTVVNSLRPYTVPLFLDQYGNYVLQCCLRFGFPWNNFIFETMLSRMWDIAQGRFGSRAMRACLESHHATKDQQRMLAAAIALHSVQLATNQNGALLLTWYLDTCNFPCRRVVLAPRLVPHLVHLCTHKVAYLTVLKVINQRSEPEARDTVLKALFFSENDKTLEDILSDHAYGATLIFKILTTPCFDEGLRAEVVRNVRNVLCRIKASPSQGYKRLMDEVGLPARTGKGERESHTPNGHHTPHQERHRSTSQHGSNSGRRHQQDMERQYSGQYHQSPHHQQYPMQNASPVTSAVDHNGISAYDQFSPSFSPSAINNQYQQMLLRGVGPTDVYNGMTGAGLGGFPAVAPPHDLRGMPQNPFMTQPAARPLPMNANPLMQQPGFAPPSYNPLVASYQYQMPYLPQQQPMMQAQNGGRRGRR